MSYKTFWLVGSIVAAVQVVADTYILAVAAQAWVRAVFTMFCALSAALVCWGLTEWRRS